MLESAAFHPDNLRKAAAQGFINATDCADYLTKKGVPFRDAYHVVGALVKQCVEAGCTWKPCLFPPIRRRIRPLRKTSIRPLTCSTAFPGARWKAAQLREVVRAQIAWTRAQLAERKDAE